MYYYAHSRVCIYILCYMGAVIWCLYMEQILEFLNNNMCTCQGCITLYRCHLLQRFTPRINYNVPANYICAYIYIYICVCVYICIFTYKYIHIFIYIQKRGGEKSVSHIIHTQSSMCIRYRKRQARRHLYHIIQVWARMCLYIHIHIHIYIQAYTYIQGYIYIYQCMYRIFIVTYIYIYIQIDICVFMRL